MSYKVNYNERSWAIDLISHIKSYIYSLNRPIKEAGGETSILKSGGSLFPDVLLFADSSSAKILQGWELKMPDTRISDKDFRENAEKKARTLGLDSFVLWNVRTAVMYVLDPEMDSYEVAKRWREIKSIEKRKDVKEKSEEWKRLAIEIIDTVNDYLDDGFLKGKRFIDAYSSGGVTSLILENTKMVSDALELRCQIDNLFKAELTLWQNEEYQDYGGAGREKIEVLSRSILSNWTGKFLFAHILSSRSSIAKNMLDKINNNTKVKEAVSIFHDISISCNFWTIFSNSLGLEYIPDLVWEDFLSFNNLLKDLKIANIDQGQLSSILEDTVNINSRKLIGQYTTPPVLAKLLVILAVKNIKDDKVADFCSGSGTIVREVFEAKLKVCSAEKASKEVYASDLDHNANQITTFALAKPSGMDLPIRVFNADIFSLHPDYEVLFRDPKDGSEIRERLGHFDVVLGNLPFISQSGRAAFSDSIENTLNKLPSSYDFIGDNELKFINKKSDIYAYIPVHILPLLKENGSLGIIISNSWLGTDWGVGFLYQLIADYHLKTVITSGAGRWFPNSKVVTNLLVLTKRGRNDRTLGHIDFVTLKRPLVDLEDDGYLATIASHILMGSVSNEAIDIRSIHIEDLFRFLKLGVGLNAQFCECDWILNIPLTPISNYLDVFRGARRGWDKLFYPSSDEGIEEEFLEPVLLNSKEIKNYLVNPDYEKKAFICSLSEDELLSNGKNGAYNWIQSFKGSYNKSGKLLVESLQRKGLYWYEFGNVNKADFVIPLNPDKRFFVARTQTPSIINQRLICLKVKNNYDIELIHALLNSVISYFLIETAGFGRGEGALDLSATTLKKISMLDPEGLSKDQIFKIKENFKPLLNPSRNILNIDEELSSEDRINFDNAVLEAYGLLHLRSRIYDDLLKLVSIRLEARNIY